MNINLDIQCIADELDIPAGWAMYFAQRHVGILTEIAEEAAGVAVRNFVADRAPEWIKDYENASREEARDAEADRRYCEMRGK